MKNAQMRDLESHLRKIQQTLEEIRGELAGLQNCPTVWPDYQSGKMLQCVMNKGHEGMCGAWSNHGYVYHVTKSPA